MKQDVYKKFLDIINNVIDEYSNDSRFMNIDFIEMLQDSRKILIEEYTGIDLSDRMYFVRKY